MGFTLLDSIKDQSATLKINHVDLTGKTIIVTGSNAGIGYATVCHLVTMNPTRIILACRNTKKAEDAIKTIKETTDAPNVILEAQELDLTSFASCRAFAKQYQESGYPLHILINNAGVGDFKSAFTLTEDGHEATLATNHLGTALVTLLLLPVIRNTAAQNDSTYPRIVTVASEMHHRSNLPEKAHPNIIKAMNDPSKKDALKIRYNTTKLLNVIFTRGLANHLQNSKNPQDHKISALVINPGLVASNFFAEMDNSKASFFARKVWSLLVSLIARNTMEGSKTSVYAATAPECGIENGGINGQYFSSCRATFINKVADGPEGDALAERLWKDTNEAIGLDDLDI
ncbi:hypothetical protein BGZ76_004896 [Entomortierella beljakovae]|nr:hypothetical protein BGZ76_004896 [Entomortierella beljakovae]